MVAALRILLVEDNASDIELMQLAFEESALPNELRVSHDGIEALAHLSACIAESPNTLPDVMLLDLNMPRMGGHELLDIMKQNPALKQIPVIIFTSSTQHSDLLDSYTQRANCYVAKPSGLQASLEVPKKVVEFWMKAALPREDVA